MIVDRFSKFMIAVPTTKDVSARQAAKLFHTHVFRHFGLPRKLISDRDSKFTSHFWGQLFSLLGTTLALSTANHPETDCQSERHNGTLEMMLRALSRDRSED